MAHSYASFVICLFGIFSNAYMIFLLTRPHTGTTINQLLAVTATSDMALMLSHMIYKAHFDFFDQTKCPIELLSYGWVLFQLVHSIWSVYLRGFSLWLSVFMGFYRKHVLAKAELMGHEKRVMAIKMVIAAALLVFIVCFPLFFQNTIAPGPMALENDTLCPQNHSPYYSLRMSKYALRDGQVLLKTAYWSNGIMLKLCPCILLTYSLISIMRLMYYHNRRYQAMCRQQRLGTPRQGSDTNSNTHFRPHRSHMTCTGPSSLILVTILCTTIVCELPNTIFSFMSALFPDDYLKPVYTYFGDAMDFLSLISCTSASILYFSMSGALRRSCTRTFLRLCAKESSRSVHL